MRNYTLQNTTLTTPATFKSQKHPFHILDASPFPFLTGLFLLTLLTPLTFSLHGVDVFGLPLTEMIHASFFAALPTDSITESETSLFVGSFSAATVLLLAAQRAEFSTSAQPAPQFPLKRGPLFTPLLFIAAYLGIFFFYFFALALKPPASCCAENTDFFSMNTTSGFTALAFFLLFAVLVALICTGLLGIVSSKTVEVPYHTTNKPYADWLRCHASRTGFLAERVGNVLLFRVGLSAFLLDVTLVFWSEKLALVHAASHYVADAIRHYEATEQLVGGFR